LLLLPLHLPPRAVVCPASALQVDHLRAAEQVVAVLTQCGTTRRMSTGPRCSHKP
jgi:hypothetical protein